MIWLRPGCNVHFQNYGTWTWTRFSSINFPVQQPLCTRFNNGINDIHARSVLAFANLEMWRMELAIELFELHAHQRENPQQLANLAHAYFRTGHLAESEEVLSRLLSAADKEFVSPAVIALVYFAADRAGEGFVLLQEAVAVRAREMIFIQVDHIFDEYREDPRYLDLVRTIGFQGSKPSVPEPNAPASQKVD